MRQKNRQVEHSKIK